MNTFEEEQLKNLVLRTKQGSERIQILTHQVIKENDPDKVQRMLQEVESYKQKIDDYYIGPKGESYKGVFTILSSQIEDVKRDIREAYKKLNKTREEIKFYNVLPARLKKEVETQTIKLQNAVETQRILEKKGGVGENNKALINSINKDKQRAEEALIHYQANKNTSYKNEKEMAGKAVIDESNRIAILENSLNKLEKVLPTLKTGYKDFNENAQNFKNAAESNLGQNRPRQRAINDPVVNNPSKGVNQKLGDFAHSMQRAYEGTSANGLGLPQSKKIGIPDNNSTNKDKPLVLSNHNMSHGNGQKLKDVAKPQPNKTITSNPLKPNLIGGSGSSKPGLN